MLSTRLARSPIAPSALSVLRAVGRGGASRRLRQRAALRAAMGRLRRPMPDPLRAVGPTKGTKRTLRPDANREKLRYKVVEYFI